MVSNADVGSGSGSRLPTPVLIVAGVSALVAVCVSTLSIVLQLKNYRKPVLQRMVVRIMLMVPLYAISSLISLFSVEAAFVIDAIRDIYEAFVIYCFFELLLAYLGGERSVLILLHGRPPKEHVFPVNIFKREIDVSDPHTFLSLKRGILQYVQVKPLLAAATLVLKALGKYNDGNFRANSGYLYVSIIYNISICLALYCLAMFWVCVNDDLKRFRPIPKFLCVKGILFFSFWQSIAISVLVAAHVIIRLGPYTDAEHISVGLNDTLICIEMPFFAIAHNYAFSYKDYIDPHISFVARMRFYYAFRDAFGLRDVIENSKSTLRGEGMDYREFEPAEGFMHQGVGRERRIRAGLRYSKGGQRKYWLPKATTETQPQGRAERVVNKAISTVAGPDQTEEVHAPLLSPQAEDVVHLAPDMQRQDDIWGSASDRDLDSGYELPFGDIDDADEELFVHSRKYVFGDYNYPCIDVSSEQAREVMWSEEERVLRDERGAWFSPIRGAKGRVALQGRERPLWEGYGAVGITPQPSTSSKKSRSDTSFGDGKVIDFERDTAEETDVDETRGVQLKWTKTRHQKNEKPSRSASQSHSRSGTPRSPINNSQRSTRLPTGAKEGTTGVSSPGPSSAGNSGQNVNDNSASLNRVRSPLALFRRTSSSKTDSSSHRNSPTLPPDAVDLVVEDSDAVEKGQERERRKGEPAVRAPGLKKVYRRGFEVDMTDGEIAKGEVEVERNDDDDDDDAGKGRVDVGEHILDEIGDVGRQRVGEHQHNVQQKQQSQVWESQSPEGVVARAQTPPLHARLSISPYGIPEDDNPWAS